MAGKALRHTHPFKNAEDRQQQRPPKIFVLDTNVILHDSHSIFNFQDNDIYIPVSVIEELDKFKKGDDNLGFNARAFVRELDRISDNTLFDQGISLGKGRGHIKIEMGHGYTQAMKDSLIDDIPDHRIIATAVWLRDNTPDRKVILVTKDVNMRLKAKALGLMAQDYLSDKVEEKRIVRTEKEVLTVRNMRDQLIHRLDSSPDGVPYSELGIRRRPACNQYYRIYDSARNVTLARYDNRNRCVIKVRPRIAYGITPRNDEQTLALDAIMNPDIRLIALTGRAGTGKTLLALAGALEQAGNFEQILLSRPVIPLKNQELGFLPGSVDDKIGPYMLPLFDNLAVIKSCFAPGSKELAQIEDMQKKEKLLINPLAYIRGRSLGNVFFIVDESQNLTPHEVKTIITRAGEGTKIVFTGDIYQIDQPYLDFNSNGLTHLCDKFFGQSVFAHINMTKGERSELSELAGKLL
ncbi:MAG TPA: PhoH family protein [Candidatus Coprenecus pullistercoris]|nr:PhoH family protein [Candidatus Coprenecus pullistercoris]